MIGPLPDPSAVFEALIADTDAQRATERFTLLVADVVGIVHPDVDDVTVDAATWGDGVYVGEFGSGARIRVWQTSFEIARFTPAARAAVEELYENAMLASRRLGYQLKSWTLTLPIDLEQADTKAWHSWVRSKKKSSKVAIDLWTASRLRRRLLSPEGEAVRRVHLEALASPAVRTLRDLVDAEQYEDTLFVRQLHAARIVETFSAKEAFFNAEILGREVEDKNVPTELDLLREWRIYVRATWEDVFIDACQTTAGDIPPGVLKSVSDSIHDDRPKYSTRMSASTLHGVGIMHQVVDAGEAGWVRDWREVAKTHTMARETLPPAVDVKEQDTNVR